MSNKRFFLKKIRSGADIPLSGVLTVGREDGCDVLLTEGQPSRKHALITVADGVAFLEDCQSTNGTFVNDERINSRVKLKDKAEVRFDTERYLFRVEGDDKTQVRRIDPVPDKPSPEGGLRRPNWMDSETDPQNKTKIIPLEEIQKEREDLLEGVDLDDAYLDVTVPQLVVLLKGRPPMRFELKLPAGSATKEWSIGSATSRDIVLDYPGVSALHAKLIRDGSHWRIRDELATNRVIVNGVRTPRSNLQSDDRIRLGSVECLFKLPVTSGRAAAPSRSVAAARKVGRTESRFLIVVAGIVVVAALAAVGFIYRNSLLAWLN
jgi:pSer/pThr/pTyr-binding forkhead associated (FHA) protein